MATENTSPCSEFWMIIVNLESDNTIANINGVYRASTLIAGDMLPEPALLLRLITALASNLSKSQLDIALKTVVHSTLISIREAIIRNNMNMDPSVCRDTLQAIQCCLMDESFRRVQRHGALVRLWNVREQLIAVNIICIFLCRALVHVTDARCVTAFASLMLSPYSIVVHACEVALLSLPPVVAGFIFALTRAYCYHLTGLLPLSPLQISNVIVMLDRLKQIILTMADHPEFNDLAMHVLRALKNENLAVRKKVLNMAVSLLSPLNVDNVLRFLRTELDMAASSDTPSEYCQMLEKAVIECHSAYPARITPFIQDPKYFVYVDCIDYIKDIAENNPLLRKELLTGLLRVLRHVKSSPVCAATVWAISVSSVSLSEIRCSIVAITSHFKYMLEQHNILKQINGGVELQHGYTVYSDHYSAKQGDAESKQQQPWLIEMQEFLFIHLGLTRQADGSYSIASSSRSSTNDEDGFLFVPPSLEPTDNLTRLVGSGDALLADFVFNVLSRLAEIATVDS